MSHEDAGRAEVRRLLDARWPMVHRSSVERISSVRTFVLAGSPRTDLQLSTAREAAHKLVGSLGVFGRRDASSIASIVEDALTVAELTDGDRQQVLADLDRLEALLEIEPNDC